MIATATALIQATEDSIFEDEAMSFAGHLTQTYHELNKEQFAKAMFLYATILASNAVDRATKVLLNESQLKELMTTIDEVESIRNEVMNDGQ